VEREVIADADELYRRLAPDFVKADGSISSAAFKRGKIPDPEVSVDLARLTTPVRCLVGADRAHFGLGVLIAAVPRRMGLTVRHAPVDGNWAHSVIEGQTDRQQPRLLAQQTRLIKWPDAPQ
jgi:hypothetical protein